MDRDLSKNLWEATRRLSESGALLITAGAGMGVDSGLPDFRGKDGFWNAYPLYRKLGLDFSSIARPKWFAEDPYMAWGFYGHRFNLYRDTQPHNGFQVLRNLSSKIGDSYVYTSNVDGHFHKAGFEHDRIVECHGTLRYLQCFDNCGQSVFSSNNIRIEVDPDSLKALDPLPKCPSCGGLARPNVLMFWDFDWDRRPSAQAELQIEHWLDNLERTNKRLVIIEIGAGLNIPTIRDFSESAQSRFDAPLIRINKRDAEGPRDTLSFYEGANYILSQISEMMA